MYYELVFSRQILIVQINRMKEFIKKTKTEIDDNVWEHMYYFLTNEATAQ